MLWIILFRTLMHEKRTGQVNLMTKDNWLGTDAGVVDRLPAGRNFSLSLDENTSLIAFLDSPVSILRTLMAVSDRYDCKIAVS